MKSEHIVRVSPRAKGYVWRCTCGAKSDSKFTFKSTARLAAALHKRDADSK